MSEALKECSNRKQFLIGLMTALATLASGLCLADSLRIATASNFMTVMPVLAETFERRSEHEIVVIPGSSGKHFAQIVNGAPFDAFFSADAERPRELERRGEAVAGSRFTYALGRLVLWSPKANRVDASGQVLQGKSFRKLAIANPRLAPYGRAARETLEALGLWADLQDRLVRGENVGQAFQFVHSTNADLGFVALSQVIQWDTGSQWLVPSSFHSAIEQQAVLLNDGAAREFLDWIRGDEARRIIEGHGYLDPGVAR